MTTKLTITSQIQKIADEQSITLAPLVDDMVLLDSGLDSLCFAILVARLGDLLGVDPLRTAPASAAALSSSTVDRFSSLRAISSRRPWL